MPRVVLYSSDAKLLAELTAFLHAEEEAPLRSGLPFKDLAFLEMPLPASPHPQRVRRLQPGDCTVWHNAAQSRAQAEVPPGSEQYQQAWMVIAHNTQLEALREDLGSFSHAVQVYRGSRSPAVDSVLMHASCTCTSQRVSLTPHPVLCTCNVCEARLLQEDQGWIEERAREVDEQEAVEEEARRGSSQATADSDGERRGTYRREEAKQEVVCFRWLQWEASRAGLDTLKVKRQERYFDPAESEVYVQADVQDAMGDPWEVKNADSIHAVQSAHGQADFQRWLSAAGGTSSATHRRSALALHTARYRRKGQRSLG